MTQITATGKSPENLKAINGTQNDVEQQPGGFGALGHGDFLKLMITQLQQQDPFEPVDNKDMLAQMAQFSALAGSSDTNETLVQISDKLDALIEAQKAANSTQPATQTA